MKLNIYSKCLAAVALIALLASLGTTAAGAADRNDRVDLEQLAVAQTQQLFKFYINTSQTASPPKCNQGQELPGRGGVLLLPTLSFAAGNLTFRCNTDAEAVLLDLGGYIPTEDPRFPESSYQVGGVGAPIAFSKDNLQTICADVILTTHLTAAPAHLDNNPRAIPGTKVITSNFTVQVNPGAQSDELPFYSDSVTLGHRGRLTSCYAGYKALVPLNPGSHVIDVNLSGLTGAPTHFIYRIDVNRH